MLSDYLLELGRWIWFNPTRLQEVHEIRFCDEDAIAQLDKGNSALRNPLSPRVCADFGLFLQRSNLVQAAEFAGHIMVSGGLALSSSIAANR